jgi:CRISPR-associated protein Cas2
MSAEERNFYVLAYDICDDKRRAKIARLMESMGVRVQGSVFEAYLSQKELESVTRKALRLMRKEQDSLRIYSLCRACLEKVKTHGQGQVTPAPGLMIV